MTENPSAAKAMVLRLPNGTAEAVPLQRRTILEMTLTAYSPRELRWVGCAPSRFRRSRACCASIERG